MALQVTVAGVDGAEITLSAHNSGSESETRRLRVVVTLADGSQETLTSTPVTVGPGATETVTLVASGPIRAWEDPNPVG